MSHEHRSPLPRPSYEDPRDGAPDRPAYPPAPPVRPPARWGSHRLSGGVPAPGGPGHGVPASPAPGAPAAPAHGHGVPGGAGGFGAPPAPGYPDPVGGGFGPTHGTPAAPGGFGAAAAPGGFGAAAAPGGFGALAAPGGPAAPAGFGGPASAPPFAPPEPPGPGTASRWSGLGTATPGYGAPAAPAYEAPATPGYGAPAAPGYGAPAAQGYEAPAAPAYGAPPAPGYGAPTSARPGTPGSYGAPDTPGYGAPDSPGYGVSGTPGYGARDTPGYGAAGPAPASWSGADASEASADGYSNQAVYHQIRQAVVHRVQYANALHASHYWDLRRTKPVGPHALVFLYACLDPRFADPRRPYYEIKAASRLFRDGSEVQDLPALLAELCEIAEGYLADGGIFDPVAQMTQAGEPMPAEARYVGVSVSTLLGTGDETGDAPPGAGGMGIPGRNLVVMSDDNLLVVERPARAHEQVVVHSTCPHYSGGGVEYRSWLPLSPEHQVHPAWRWLQHLNQLVMTGQERKAAMAGTVAGRRRR
ncbi:hypothetical protein [Micromonospora chersina]|uniref:Uncharacterized protein n=1 Tax=Micromonospora chersina TaxID=47854 RepID=A0A1C6VZE8_9ACTN|nr:hypothetical protein [Micromonospora chersina]SCL71567.1 hypothetical protein GA0070603_5984 [Micromonospora chersina]